MRIVEDDDAGYLAWIDGHQHGFVVNSYRKPDPRRDGETARRRDGEKSRRSEAGGRGDGETARRQGRTLSRSDTHDARRVPASSVEWTKPGGTPPKPVYYDYVFPGILSPSSWRVTNPGYFFAINM